MSEEEKKDILFQIDMQLYDEFNDTIATMNDHLGDIYSLRDIEKVEQAEKEKERYLLREAIKTLQKENERLKENYEVLSLDLGKALKELGLPEDTIIADELVLEINKKYINKDKIREYVNSPEFLDWHLGFTLLDELEYRKNNINELLEEK